MWGLTWLPDQMCLDPSIAMGLLFLASARIGITLQGYCCRACPEASQAVFCTVHNIPSFQVLRTAAALLLASIGHGGMVAWGEAPLKS